MEGVNSQGISLSVGVPWKVLCPLEIVLLEDFAHTYLLNFQIM